VSESASGDLVDARAEVVELGAVVAEEADAHGRVDGRDADLGGLWAVIGLHGPYA